MTDSTDFSPSPSAGPTSRDAGRRRRPGADPANLPGLDRLKDQARRMRARAAARGAPITHSAALERLARALGCRDWNTLRGLAARRPEGAPAAPGERVALRYMGVPAQGRVQTVRAADDGPGLWRVALDLDAPMTVCAPGGIPVVRRRIMATVDGDGVSRDRRSDGTPHLALGAG